MERHPRHQNGKEKDGLISLSTENSPSTDGLFVFGGKNLLVKAGPKKYLLIRGWGTMEDLDDETSTDFPVEEATTRSPKEEPPRSDRLPLRKDGRLSKTTAIKVITITFRNNRTQKATTEN